LEADYSKGSLDATTFFTRVEETSTGANGAGIVLAIDCFHGIIKSASKQIHFRRVSDIALQDYFIYTYYSCFRIGEYPHSGQSAKCYFPGQKVLTLSYETPPINNQKNRHYL
jgi:hypothetical protein